MIYFDNAATTVPKPECVVQAVAQAMCSLGNSGRGAHSPYWTRTQGRNGYSANCTKSKGQIGWIRVVVQNEGCRPACLIDLSRVEITGGTGTADDPYMLRPRE